MAELMLVNPRRRKRRASAKKRVRVTRARRNPRRKRRTMSAAQAAFFGPRKRRRVRVTRARKNPRRRSSSRRSGLLTSLSPKGIMGAVAPAAIGAAGALAIDALWAVLPVPASLKTGQFAPAIKALGVLGIGALASRVKVIPQNLVKPAVAAALTITAYNFLKAQLQAFAPNLQLGEYVDGIGYYGAGQFLPDQSGMGAYVSGGDGIQALAGAHAHRSETNFDEVS